jgi:hypothetical protein
MLVLRKRKFFLLVLSIMVQVVVIKVELCQNRTNYGKLAHEEGVGLRFNPTPIFTYLSRRVKIRSRLCLKTSRF